MSNPYDLASKQNISPIRQIPAHRTLGDNLSGSFGLGAQESVVATGMHWIGDTLDGAKARATGEQPMTQEEFEAEGLHYFTDFKEGDFADQARMRARYQASRERHEAKAQGAGLITSFGAGMVGNTLLDAPLMFIPYAKMAHSAKVGAKVLQGQKISAAAKTVEALSSNKLSTKLVQGALAGEKTPLKAGQTFFQLTKLGAVEQTIENTAVYFGSQALGRDYGTLDAAADTVFGAGILSILGGFQTRKLMKIGNMMARDITNSKALSLLAEGGDIQAVVKHLNSYSEDVTGTFMDSVERNPRVQAILQMDEATFNADPNARAELQEFLGRNRTGVFFSTLKGNIPFDTSLSVIDAKRKQHAQMARITEALPDYLRGEDVSGRLTPEEMQIIHATDTKLQRLMEIVGGLEPEVRGTMDALDQGSKPTIDISGSTRKNPFFQKDVNKFQGATKLISRGSPRSSSAAYAEAAGDLANSGKYEADDIVGVSVEGNRGGRVGPDFKEIDKAIEAKANFQIDRPADRNREYNVGEREVATYLKKRGYEEPNGDGLFVPAGRVVPTKTSVKAPEPVFTKADSDKVIDAADRFIQSLGFNVRVRAKRKEGSMAHYDGDINLDPDVRPDRALQLTFHELVHHFRNTNKKVYDALNSVVERFRGDQVFMDKVFTPELKQQYQDKFGDEFMKKNLAFLMKAETSGDDATVRRGMDVMVADVKRRLNEEETAWFMTEATKHPEFWQALKQRDPKVFEQFKLWLRRLWDRITGNRRINRATMTADQKLAMRQFGEILAAAESVDSGGRGRGQGIMDALDPKPRKPVEQATKELEANLEAEAAKGREATEARSKEAAKEVEGRAKKAIQTPLQVAKERVEAQLEGPLAEIILDTRSNPEELLGKLGEVAETLGPKGSPVRVRYESLVERIIGFKRGTRKQYQHAKDVLENHKEVLTTRVLDEQNRLAAMEVGKRIEGVLANVRQRLTQADSRGAKALQAKVIHLEVLQKLFKDIEKAQVSTTTFGKSSYDTRLAGIEKRMEEADRGQRRISSDELALMNLEWEVMYDLSKGRRNEAFDKLAAFHNLRGLEKPFDDVTQGPKTETTSKKVKVATIDPDLSTTGEQGFIRLAQLRKRMETEKLSEQEALREYAQWLDEEQMKQALAEINNDKVLHHNDRGLRRMKTSKGKLKYLKSFTDGLQRRGVRLFGGSIQSDINAQITKDMSKLRTVFAKHGFLDELDNTIHRIDGESDTPVTERAAARREASNMFVWDLAQYYKTGEVPSRYGERAKDFEELGEALRDTLHSQITQLNEYGAGIRLRDDHLGMNQRWSDEVIRRMGFDAFRAKVDDWVDWTRVEESHGGMMVASRNEHGYADEMVSFDKEVFIRQWFDEAVSPVKPQDHPSTNIARSFGKARMIHMKPEFEQQALIEFSGHGSLGRLLQDQIRHRSEMIAVMRNLGNEPLANFDKIVRKAGIDANVNTTRVETGTKLDRALVASGAAHRTHKMDVNHMYKTVEFLTGASDNPANHDWSFWGKSYRQLSNISFMWTAGVSAITDVPITLLTLEQMGADVSISQLMGAMKRSATRRFIDKDRGELTAFFEGSGAAFDALKNAGARRLALAESNGDTFLAKGSEMMFTINGVSGWTSMMQEAFVDVLTQSLARQARSGSWDPHMRMTMRSMGFTQDDFLRLSDGIVDINGVERVGPPSFEGQDLHMKLLQFFSEYRDKAVIVPDASTQSLIRFGTQAGTWQGEAVRSVMQYASFPVAMNRVVNRMMILNAEGRNPWTTGQIGVTRMAVFMGGMMGMAYAAMVMKDLARLRSPSMPWEMNQAVLGKLIDQSGIFGAFGVLMGAVKDGRVSSVIAPNVSTQANVMGKLFNEGFRGALYASKSYTGDNIPVFGPFITTGLAYGFQGEYAKAMRIAVNYRERELGVNQLLPIPKP